MEKQLYSFTAEDGNRANLVKLYAQMPAKQQQEEDGILVVGQEVVTTQEEDTQSWMQVLQRRIMTRWKLGWKLGRAKRRDDGERLLDKDFPPIKTPPERRFP